jgi:hypothetical protein
MYSLLRKQYPESELIYYEDINFPENFSLTKNKGFQNIKIANLDYVKNRFQYFWKSKVE